MLLLCVAHLYFFSFSDMMHNEVVGFHQAYVVGLLGIFGWSVAHLASRIDMILCF